MFGINELSWTPFPNSLLFNAPQKTFKAEVNNIPASEGKKTNLVRWYSSTNSYWTSWGSTGGATSTCTNTCDTVAKYLDNSMVKQALADGQGFTFLSIGPNDTWADGTKEDYKCPDINRKQHEDGNCTNECKDGYEFKEDYVAGRDFYEPNQCVEAKADPNDCATDHRKVKDDKTCGDCVSGYSENDDGDCVAEEGTNWMLWGGLTVVGVLALSQIL